MRQKIQRYYVPGPVAQAVAAEMGLELPDESPVADIDEKELIAKLFEKKAFRQERGSVRAERVNAKMVDLNAEAGRLASHGLSKQARAQGLSSGLSIEILGVEGVEAAEGGVKVRSHVLKKASVLAEVDCALYHIKRADPVQVMVSIEEGRVVDPPELPFPEEQAASQPIKAAFFRRSWARVPSGEYLFLGKVAQAEADVYKKVCAERNLSVVPLQHPEHSPAYEVLALTQDQIKVAEWEFNRLAEKKCKTEDCVECCKDGEEFCPACLKRD